MKISITELADLFNITKRTIRYYEEIGLIEKAVRLKGKRYFNENETVYKMNEICFLKSLNFKLEDIEATLKNPLYIKPLLLNIRLELVRIEISRLNSEATQIASQLKHYTWEPLEITNNDILKKMKENCYKLSYIEKSMSENKDITMEDSIKIVEFYKKWHEKAGINLSDDHIKIIAYNPNIILKEELKNIFQAYCQAIDSGMQK